MKIGILTQPLHNNYGGLLQAYALQYYLVKQGHDVLTVDFKGRNKPRFWGIRGIILNSIQKYILCRHIKHVLPITEQKKQFHGQHTRRFASEYIRTTQIITSLSEFTYIKQYQFDAYIVGSDQVWRPFYSPGMPAFFLDFLGDERQSKRIAYAASFGVDHCNEFRKNDLPYYANCLQQFDAIGVREDSAVELCRDHFSVDAVHVIDPTLLLDKADYCTLVKQDNIQPSMGNMMVYVLDKDPEKQAIISTVANARGLTPYTVMQDETTGIYPPVTQWIRGFMDAEYVVTDSFHGVAFAIIFNKPFIAIGNHSRGLARFTSILGKFGLEERLVFSLQDLTVDKINQPINFSAVNKLKMTEQQIAYTFLQEALHGEKI